MTSSSVTLPLHFTKCILLVCIIGSLRARVVIAHEAKSLHLTYYVEEIRGSPQPPNATLLPAAGTGQGDWAKAGWGSFLVFEHRLMEGTTADSNQWGIITGTGVATTRGGIESGGIQLSAQHIFNKESPYPAGSSLTLTGTLGHPVTGWECLILGGTGFFRGYRGYALGVFVPEAYEPPRYVFKWDIYLSKCNCPDEYQLSHCPAGP